MNGREVPEMSSIRDLLSRGARLVKDPRLFAACLFGIVAAAITLRFMRIHPALSVVDEFQYIDAVDKATRWDLVFSGDKTDQYARMLAACRGAGLVPGVTTYMGECGGLVPDSSTFIHGYTSADIHSPVYFFVTAWLSQPIQHLLNVELITAARLTSLLWLWVGMIVLAWFLRRLGAGRYVQFALPIALVAMPVFRLTNSYVTPDALNLVAGSLILGSALMYVRGEWGPWRFILSSSVFAVVKFQNLFAVIAALLFIGWYGVSTWKFERSSRSIAIEGLPGSIPRVRIGQYVAMTIIPIAFGFTWLVIRAITAVPVDRPPLDPPADGELLRSLFAMDDSLQVLFAGTLPMGATAPWSVFPSLLLGLGVAALFATALFDVHKDRVQQSFAASGIVSLLGIGPAIILLFALVFSVQVGVLNRYVMPLAPLLCFPIAWRMKSSVAQVLLVIFSIVASAYSLIFAAQPL